MSTDLISTTADKAMVHVAKDLLDSSELRSIQYLDFEARAYLRVRCLPAPMFRSGVYLLPLALLEDTITRLDEYKVKRDELFTAFKKVYKVRKDEAKERLADAYDENEYPSLRDLESYFDFDYNLFTFGTPDSIKGVSGALFKRQADKAEQMWADAATTIRDALRESMTEVVNDMAERMSGQADGKPRRFKDAFIDKINEFLNTFQARNLTNDADLAKLVEKAHAVMKGLKAEDLRGDDKLRAQVGKDFGKIKDALAKMMEEKPKRKLTLKDEV